MTPARLRIPKAAIPALLLLALTLGAQAQWVEDSIEVETRWVGSLCYNPTANVVYGCGEQPGAFFAIDCSTNEVVASFPHRNALQVVHDSIDNKAYCIVYSTGDDDSILIIDGTTHARIGAIPLCWASFMVWDPVANRLYVSEFGDNSVAVIDCATDTVIARIRTSSEPLRMHLSTGHRKLYVQCQGSDRLNIVDLNTLEVIENLRLEGMPEAGCYSQAVDKYYCGAGVEVVVVDGAADTVVRSIALTNDHPISAVSVEAHRLVMVGGTHSAIDTVYVIDATRDSVVRALSGVATPRSLYWNGASDLVYCASTRWSQVAIIAGDGSRMLDVLRVGEGPKCFAAAPRHRRLYVGCSKVYVIRDTISGIAEDGGTRALAQPAPLRVCSSPFRAQVWIEGPSVSGGELLVYAENGRLVRALQPVAGSDATVRYRWDGRDAGGRSVSPGVYVVVLSGPAQSRAKVVKLE